MNKHKMKGVRAGLHQLVTVRGRKHFSQSASGQMFIKIDGKQYLSIQRGKHRGLPGRGMSVNRLLVDDLHFEVFSSPPSCLSYGSMQFTKEYLAELTQQRAGEVNPYANVSRLDNSLDI
jgi:hypothetical protein